jgi:hypothetical protein
VPDVVSLSALGALGLVGAGILAVGFLLRREAEEFFTENKQDAKAVRAVFQGRFHQRFAEEVNLTIDRAAAGATTLELKHLKETIAKESLEPDHETGVGKLGTMLTDRDAVWGSFARARDKKIQIGGRVIGLGILLIVGGLAFLLPSDVIAADGPVIAVVLGFIGLLLMVDAASAFSDYTAATTKFYEYCDRELKEL